MVTKHFGADPTLKKIFNKNSLKMSYRAMPNMGQILSKHNKKILRDFQNTQRKKTGGCNCQGGPTKCPLNGNCLIESSIYQAEVSTQEETLFYIGLASNSFKERYSNHKSSFNLRHKQFTTTLSKYIWELKDKVVAYSIKWSTLRTAPVYTVESKTCHLCQTEATLILLMDKKTSINKREEIMSKCRHRDKNLLANFVTSQQPVHPVDQQTRFQVDQPAEDEEDKPQHSRRPRGQDTSRQLHSNDQRPDSRIPT